MGLPPKLLGLVMLVSAVCAAAAFAAEPAHPRCNAVEFQAEAQREVRNDLLNATLYVELNDASAAAQEVTAPNLESGVSLVTVVASGTIEVTD